MQTDTLGLSGSGLAFGSAGCLRARDRSFTCRVASQRRMARLACCEFCSSERPLLRKITRPFRAAEMELTSLAAVANVWPSSAVSTKIKSGRKSRRANNEATHFGPGHKLRVRSLPVPTELTTKVDRSRAASILIVRRKLDL